MFIILIQAVYLAVKVFVKVDGVDNALGKNIFAVKVASCTQCADGFVVSSNGSCLECTGYHA